MAGGQESPPGQAPRHAAVVSRPLEHGVEVPGSIEEIEGETICSPLLRPVPPGEQASDREGHEGAQQEEERVGARVAGDAHGTKQRRERECGGGGGQGHELGEKGEGEAPPGMAAPPVAGVATLYKSGGDASSSTIRSWLLNNATTSVVKSNITGTPNRLLYKAGL